MRSNVADSAVCALWFQCFGLIEMRTHFREDSVRKVPNVRVRPNGLIFFLKLREVLLMVCDLLTNELPIELDSGQPG